MTETIDEKTQPSNPFVSPGSAADVDIAPEELPPLNPYVLWGGAFAGLTIELLRHIQNGNLMDDSIPFLTLAVMGLIAGIASGFGLALLIRAWRYRAFSLLMPGHWFLIANGTFVLEALTFLLLYDVLGVDRSLSHLVSHSLQGLCFAGLFIAVTSFSQESRWWRLYSWFWNLVFALEVFGLVMDLIYDPQSTGPRDYTFVVLPQRFFVLLTLPFLLIGMTSDLMRKRTRDFSHWMGVWLGVVIPLVLFVGIVLAVEVFGLR